MPSFLYFFLSILLFAISVPVDGFVFMQLWKWFVVSTFQVPPLAFGNAMGLSIIVAFATHQFIPSDMPKAERFWQMLTHQIFVPLMVLAAGLIVHNNFLT